MLRHYDVLVEFLELVDALDQLLILLSQFVFAFWRKITEIYYAVDAFLDIVQRPGDLARFQDLALALARRKKHVDRWVHWVHLRDRPHKLLPLLEGGITRMQVRRVHTVLGRRLLLVCIHL